jgi:hypothetical protein
MMNKEANMSMSEVVESLNAEFAEYEAALAFEEYCLINDEDEYDRWRVEQYELGTY